MTKIEELNQLDIDIMEHKSHIKYLKEIPEKDRRYKIEDLQDSLQKFEQRKFDIELELIEKNPKELVKYFRS